MKKLLVRADDLGYSEGINYGIEKTVKEGIIRSVGLMPNMPAAAHGLALVRGTGVCLGLHTNICVGKPLTASDRIPSLCQENGEFQPSAAYRNAKQDLVVLDEALIEIEAQYQRFVDLTGGKPRYFEGHAIRSANFAKGLEIIARRHNCDFLDNPPNHRPRFRNVTFRVALECMSPDYDPFDTLKRAALADAPEDEIGMVVFHPGYLDAYIMKTSSLLRPRVLEVEAACAQETKNWLRAHGVEIISYDDIPQ